MIISGSLRVFEKRDMIFLALFGFRLIYIFFLVVVKCQEIPYQVVRHKETNGSSPRKINQTKGEWLFISCIDEMLHKTLEGSHCSVIAKVLDWP